MHFLELHIKILVFGHLHMCFYRTILLSFGAPLDCVSPVGF